MREHTVKVWGNTVILWGKCGEDVGALFSPSVLWSRIMQWGIVISGVVMLAVPACATEQPTPPMVIDANADVIKVYDGDTITVDAHPWPGISIRTGVRVRGIDTPEIRGKCEGEKAAARVARDRMAKLAGAAVRLENVGKGKYAGRVVADVITAAGDNAGQVLINEGLARPYDGGKRQGWCGE